MSNKDVYGLSKFLPYKLKNWFVNRIEIAEDDIYSFTKESSLELTDEEYELILLSVALNMLEEVFISSKSSYESALKYLEKKNISKFRFGRNEHHLDSQFLAEWNRFVHSFEELKDTMRQAGLPRGRDISEIIYNVKIQNGR